MGSWGFPDLSINQEAGRRPMALPDEALNQEVCREAAYPAGCTGRWAMFGPKSAMELPHVIPIGGANYEGSSSDPALSDRAPCLAGT